MFLCSIFPFARWSSFVGGWSSARERETERKSIPLDDDGFLPLVSLLFRSKRSEILFILISRYFSKEKRQIFHEMKYFVPAV
jgi:hypothetical protein